MNAACGIILRAEFTPIVGLSEFVEINDKTYCRTKNNKEITTPILALERKT